MAEVQRPNGGVICTGTLLSSEEAARNIHALEFSLKTPDGASPRAPRPGQFYQFKCADVREHILRRPLSAYGAQTAGNGLKVRFLVEVVGWGTGLLCGLEPGQRVNVLGPLGNGFTVKGNGRCLLVAGGIGVAPLCFLAREMEKSGTPCDMLAGFKSGDRTCGPLDEVCGGVQVFTEDGTVGERGVVSEAVARHLESGYEAVYTCGPEAMMSAVAEVCERAAVPCQVSLDSRMACGIGICRGCVKEGTEGRNLCVCADGPVFDSRQVLWRGQQ